MRARVVLAFSRARGRSLMLFSIPLAPLGTSEMHAVAALDSAGGTLRPVLGLHETVCSGAAGEHTQGRGWLSGIPADGAARHAHTTAHLVLTPPVLAQTGLGAWCAALRLCSCTWGPASPTRWPTCTTRGGQARQWWCSWVRCSWVGAGACTRTHSVWACMRASHAPSLPPPRRHGNVAQGRRRTAG